MSIFWVDCGYVDFNGNVGDQLTNVQSKWKNKKTKSPLAAVGPVCLVSWPHFIGSADCFFKDYVTR